MRTCEECQIVNSEVYLRRDEINLCDSCSDAHYVICRRCLKEGLRDDYIPGVSGLLCPECHGSNYVFCSDCGMMGRPHNGRVVGRNFYCEGCYQQHSQVCDNCHETSGDCVDNYNGAFCAKCLEEHLAECSNCASQYKKQDMYEEYSGHYICNRCEIAIYSWETVDFAPKESHYEEVGSKRTFGIEIETSQCKGFSSLKNKTIWACTDDFSITGKEFITPPLYGDEGLKEIHSFCEEANSLKWESDDHCGLHLHMGIGDLDPEELKRVAFAYHHTYGMWKRFISSYRAINSMCGAPKYTLTEITKIDTLDSEDWEYFAAERDRFDAINWRAYLIHGTIELRLLNGTLDAELICNWIKTHTRFIDFVIKHTISELDLLLDGSTLYQFSALTEIIGTELATYYVGVADSYCSKVRLDLESCCPV